MSDWIEKRLLPLLMVFAAGVIVASCDDQRDLYMACAEPAPAGVHAGANQ